MTVSSLRYLVSNAPKWLNDHQFNDFFKIQDANGHYSLKGQHQTQASFAGIHMSIWYQCM